MPADPQGFSIALYQSTGVRLEPGHRVELVNDGAFFDQLEEELAGSRTSINIVMFIWRPSLPSSRLDAVLSARAKAGVACRILDVRVMAAGELTDHLTDHPQILREQRAVYPELLEGGVRIWEYQPSLLHSKTMVVDDHLALVGSINLDRLSLTAMDEAALVMSDPRVVAELMETWEADAALCREVRARR